MNLKGISCWASNGAAGVKQAGNWIASLGDILKCSPATHKPCYSLSMPWKFFCMCWMPRQDTLPVEVFGPDPGKHLNVCLNLDQGDVLLNLKVGKFCNTIRKLFFFLLNSHMKLQEAWAQWSNWLLIFLLGKRDELVDLLKFFSTTFPMVDNEAIEIVQWWLNVWKGYQTSAHQLSLLEIKMTSCVWERGKLSPSCRVPPSCCHVFLVAHWQSQDAELDGPIFWFSLQFLWSPESCWLQWELNMFKCFPRKAGFSVPVSLPSCLKLCSEEGRFLLSSWISATTSFFAF